jgi:hypothetical protein
VVLRGAKHVCGRRFFGKIVIVYTDKHPQGIPARDVRSYPIAC